MPALVETLLFWSARVRSVAVVHDEQSAFTRGRVARLGTFLAQAVSPSPAPLRSFRQVDSRDDPRVQVADLLAGIARRRLDDRRERGERSPVTVTCQSVTLTVTVAQNGQVAPHTCAAS